VRPVQLRRLEARGHKTIKPERQKAPFRLARLMLVASGRAASAFLSVQLRRLEARGHKLNGPRRQKAPSRPIHLMLVGAGQAASAFLFVQLPGLEAYVISQLAQEGKERFRGRFALLPPASLQSPSAFLTRRSIATRRLTNRPRKAKFCAEINSGIKSLY
jgi:hypothetical protein